MQCVFYRNLLTRFLPFRADLARSVPFFASRTNVDLAATPADIRGKFGEIIPLSKVGQDGEINKTQRQRSRSVWE